MERQIFTREDIATILRSVELVDKARIADGINNRPFSIQTMTLPLDSARLSTDPLAVKMPFKSMFVQDATDVYVEISVLFGTRDSVQSAVTMKKNDSINMSFPLPEAYLYWDAQAGKTVTLVFFTDAEFRSGSQISVTGGGVAIIDGSSITGPSSVNLSATTAGIIAPADPLRKKATLQNFTGADLWVGGSTVTDSGTAATQGIKIPADGIFYWRNTAALYGYSVLGGRVNRLEEA